MTKNWRVFHRRIEFPFLPPCVSQSMLAQWSRRHKAHAQWSLFPRRLDDLVGSVCEEEDKVRCWRDVCPRSRSKEQYGLFAQKTEHKYKVVNVLQRSEA